MGGFECYCALCGATMKLVDPGSNSPSALARRDRRVAKMRLRLQNGEKCPLHSDSKDEEDRDDLDMGTAEYGWYSLDEDWQYDPRLVSYESTAWLANVRCLGLNPEAEGTNRRFSTCESEPSLTAEIDKDVLFETMCRFSPEEGTCHLRIDYGVLSGSEDTFWSSVPGEEFSITNPISADDFRNRLAEQIELGAFQLSPNLTPSLVRPTYRQEGGPFSRLPALIIQYIASQLEIHDVISFSTAFESVDCATRDNHFWRSRIQTHMPWLWDMEHVLKRENLTQLDWKELFLCLQKQKTLMEPDHDIAEKARCRYMFNIAKTEMPKTSLIQRCFWVHLWQEIDNDQAIIETFWNEDGHLAGINVIIAKSYRKLGSDTMRPGRKKQALHLKAGQWISEIHLHVASTNSSLEENYAGFIGISVSSKARPTVVMSEPNTILQFVVPGETTYSHGEASSTSDLRPLIVFHEHCLVRIAVQLGFDGAITRLGILECRGKPTKPTKIFDPKKACWAPSSYMIPVHGKPNSKLAPVWSHASLGFVHIFPDPISDPEENLDPYEVLLWAKSIDEAFSLDRISAEVGAAGSGILGLETEFLHRFHPEPKRHIGQKKKESEEGEKSPGGEALRLESPEMGS
ncbi:hypothetical protein BGZ63DRAFT_406778 [Mariannaea sp. PMI_226]|nr:hypothetical protein BGZ63DRAFT_406778 [Mariannaea sp. PMI_226]